MSGTKRELPDTIGGRIQRLRVEANLTQGELAKEVGVKRETVNQWESETRDLKTAYTIKLANRFNVTCDYILRGIKAENVDIHEKTGLSDKAIDNVAMISNMMCDYKEEEDSLTGDIKISFNREPGSILNEFLESERLFSLIFYMRRLTTHYCSLKGLKECTIDDIKKRSENDFGYLLWITTNEAQRMIEETVESYGAKTMDGYTSYDISVKGAAKEEWRNLKKGLNQKNKK